MKETDKYITFDIDDKLINLYTKKPIDINFHVHSEEELNNKFLELSKDINYEFRKVILPRQSHTTNVEVINEDNLDSELLDVDAVVTNLKGVALVTSSADCQNVFIYDKKNNVIGNVHSGWKGTLNKILRNTINVMIDTYGSDPKDLVVCINPSILKCCFEVDKDVVDMFNNNFNNIEDTISLGDIKDGKQKYYIDTVEINRMELMDLGVLEDNIVTSDLCSKCLNDKFHSYRADGKEAGRNIALIVIK